MSTERKYKRKASDSKKTTAKRSKVVSMAMVKSIVKFSTPLKVQSGTASANQLDYAAPQLYCMNQCIQGTNVINRIGQSIQVEQIHIRAKVKAVLTPSIMRAMVILDHQCEGSFPLLGDIMINNAAAANYVSTYNPIFVNVPGQAKGREYTILKDVTRAIQVGGGNSDQPDSIFFEIKHTFKTPIKTIFYATNIGSVADVLTNAVTFFVTSDQSGGPSPLISYVADLYFRDCA